MTKVREMKMQRADCFKLLAACFYEPDRELFLEERLCDNLASLLSAFGCEDSAISTLAMKKALQATGQEELLVEYARLFVGPFELLAPPYGSVYLEQGGRLMGDTTVAVRKRYRESGLELEVMEAPDHIALELEFMHYLCLGEAEAWANGEPDRVLRLVADQAEFFRDYLSSWVPAFCVKVKKGTNSGFYLALAESLESFIREIAPFYEAVTPLAQSEVGCDHGTAA
ncbi:molecular chaperone [Desulfurivibrio sp. D14AmB]|uniref:TorD/DmsD family molecular chaperone n=1 Tax=Desulfurivibrio sp. D14AmB TaxID=3374370 RepID=UPI00376EC3E5